MPAQRKTRAGPAGRSRIAKRARKRTGVKTAVRRPTRSARRKRGPAVDVDGVELSSPDRVVYPEIGLTKLELARYYEAVADWMLPHLANRPLTLIRCPDDWHTCFYQKHIDENRVYHAVKPVRIREESGMATYAAVDDARGLLSLVQIGTVEFHTWGARIDRLEQPDRFTLDLDPGPGVEWKRVVQAARALRAVLEDLGLRSFVKTTGGKGLHVVVPFRRGPGWDEVKEFTRAVASLLVEAAPDEYTISVAKAKRHGKILIDYLRNARGSIAVAAYSARARSGAPASTPVYWDELTTGLKPERFNVRSLPNRMKKLGKDPWQELLETRQSITASMKRKLGL